MPPPALDEQAVRDRLSTRSRPWARASNSARTAAQTDLALFWAANYQVLWNHALRDIATAHALSIDDSARLFALVNLAMGDAVITAWDTKRHSRFLATPHCHSRRLTTTATLETVGDPDWQPLINNPNYPDYTSGANNVTGAATRSLRAPSSEATK